MRKKFQEFLGFFGRAGGLLAHHGGIVVLFLEMHRGGHLLCGEAHPLGGHDELVLHVVGAVDDANDLARIGVHGVVYPQKEDVQLLSVAAQDVGNVAVVDGVHKGLLTLVVDVAYGAVDADGDGLAQVGAQIGTGENLLGHGRPPCEIRVQDTRYISVKPILYLVSAELARRVSCILL